MKLKIQCVFLLTLILATFRTTAFADQPVRQPLCVMTYNVDLGGSGKKLMSVEAIGSVPKEVAVLYTQVIDSDFPNRAKAIAKSIKKYQPHLIGLQEISLIRRQSPGDLMTLKNTPAETVVLDFLEILTDALKAAGLRYRVAVRVENTDIELPMHTDTGFDDVRLTDSDVILVRHDVKTSHPVHRNYAAEFTKPFRLKVGELKVPIDAVFKHSGLLGITLKQNDSHLEARVRVQRGYAAVNATVSGVTYRFVNTHLEAFSPEVRFLQTQELLEQLVEEILPVVLVGDFNTSPKGQQYALLEDGGYIDIWQKDSAGTGNTANNFTKRIDYIFLRNLRHARKILTATVGDTSDDRLPSGIYPSNHAGVVAQIYGSGAEKKNDE
jgi:endonuclease/exonuclease/phosphatase family metal-dependent hydrolase